MKRIQFIFLTIALVFIAIPAQSETNHVTDWFSSTLPHSLRQIIRIENNKGGAIKVIRPNRDNDWIEIGKVLLPTEQVNENGFTASAWGRTGTLIASAVNAHHIKVGQNSKNGKGVIFSLLPLERKDTDPKQYQSYLSPDSSIYTNIMAGTQIFGGGFTPNPGSLVFVTTNDELQPTPIPTGYKPKLNDIIYIVSLKPQLPIDYIELENKFGGLIVAHIPQLNPSLSNNNANSFSYQTLDEPDFKYNLQQLNIPNLPTWLSGKIDASGRFVIGIVYRPVQGSGRFQGSTFAYQGRIRAVHPGVLCISTSPQSVIGGFQIIPHHHGNSPEMVYARQLTQWLVIGPETATSAGLEGRPPFFADYFYPCYIPLDDPNFSDTERFTQRFIVQAKLQGSEDWVIMPEGIEKLDTVFEKVTHIRIYLPVY